MSKFSLILIVLLLFGCAGHVQNSHDYATKNDMAYRMNSEKVRARLLDWFSSENISFTELDRYSYVAKYEVGDSGDLICGKHSESKQKNNYESRKMISVKALAKPVYSNKTALTVNVTGFHELKLKDMDMLKAGNSFLLRPNQKIDSRQEVKRLVAMKTGCVSTGKLEKRVFDYVLYGGK